MRCAECSTHSEAVTGTLDTTDRLGWAISSALFLSIMGALLIKGTGLAAMVIGPCCGAAVGEVLLRILGKSQKPAYLKTLGIGSVAFGTIIVFSKLLPNLTFTLMTLPPNMADMVYGLSVGLALSACYGRLRAAVG
jgi:hypothetical protein